MAKIKQSLHSPELVKLYPTDWNSVVDKALRQRDFTNTAGAKVSRAAVIKHVVAEIEKCRAEIGPTEAALLRWTRLVEVADELRVALKRAAAKTHEALRERYGLNLDAEVEKLKSHLRFLGLDPKDPKEPWRVSRGQNAVVELALIPSETLVRLNAWNHLHRPKKGRPRALVAQLTSSLRGDLTKLLDMTQEEFKDLIQAINVAGELPPQNVATLDKRDERARRRRRQIPPS